MLTRLLIESHLAKLKMMKHQGLNEYLNENDSEDTETSKTSEIPNFTPKILPDDDRYISLNFKARESLQ